MLWWIILSGAVVLALIAFAAVFAVTSLVICPRRHDLSSAFAYFGELGEEMRRTYEALQREKFSVSADDGTHLACELVAPSYTDGRKKVVIFVHGFGFNRAAALKYLPFFQRRGFYAVLFDHRNSGESGGKHTTFGAKEQHDLRAVVDAVFARFGADTIVGTVGESMGGATVLLHAALDTRLRFVVADCAYADCRDQLSYTLSKRARFLVPVLIPLASRMAKLRAGFRFEEVSPERAIASLDRPLPILFSHGTADLVVPCSHHPRLVGAYRGPKLTFIGENSRHTRCAVDHPERYDERIGELLAMAEIE